MKGMTPYLAKAYAGGVDPYGPEPDLAVAVFDPGYGCMVDPPAPRADFNAVKIPDPAPVPRNAVAGSRWAVWSGRVRLWMFVQPSHEAAYSEMCRLANDDVRNLRLERMPSDAPEPRAIDRTAEIAQKTSMVRMLLGMDGGSVRGSR